MPQRLVITAMLSMGSKQRSHILPLSNPFHSSPFLFCSGLTFFSPYQHTPTNPTLTIGFIGCCFVSSLEGWQISWILAATQVEKRGGGDVEWFVIKTGTCLFVYTYENKRMNTKYIVKFFLWSLYNSIWHKLQIYYHIIIYYSSVIYIALNKLIWNE